jgi:hypothetical protein
MERTMYARFLDKENESNRTTEEKGRHSTRLSYLTVTHTHTQSYGMQFISEGKTLKMYRFLSDERRFIGNPKSKSTNREIESINGDLHLRFPDVEDPYD